MQRRKGPAENLFGRHGVDMKRLVRHHHKRLTADEAEQICNITIVFNLLAIALLFFFALLSFFSNEKIHGVILMSVMGVAIADIAFFLITGRMSPFILITCFLYLLLCIYLQITGGQDNTGILWHYVYPLTVYYIAGIHMGSVCTAILILTEILLMTFNHIFPWQAQYPLAFKIRFLATMILMAIVGAMLEYSRWSTRRKLFTMAEKFQEASQTDELTGLSNRRALREKLEDEVARSSRNGSDFVIILCDVDYFKRINDRYGHVVGDAALRHLTETIKPAPRKYDMAARWGGEEFMFMLPNTDLDEGKKVAERIRTDVAKRPFEATGGDKTNLTISCGVGHWKSHPDLDELIRITDDRLYKAKQMGRNQVVWVD